MKSQRDIAGYIGVTPMTLRNWRRHKPNLYKTIRLGLRFQELIEASRQHQENLSRLEKEVEEEIKNYQLRQKESKTKRG